MADEENVRKEKKKNAQCSECGKWFITLVWSSSTARCKPCTEHVHIREILEEKGKQNAAREHHERTKLELQIQKAERDKEKTQVLQQIEEWKHKEKKDERLFTSDEAEKSRKHQSDEAELQRQYERDKEERQRQHERDKEERQRQHERDKEERQRQHERDKEEREQKHQLEMKKNDEAIQQRQHEFEEKKLDDAKQERQHQLEMKKLDEAKQKQQHQLEMKKFELEIKKVQLEMMLLHPQQAEQINTNNDEEIISPGESQISQGELHPFKDNGWYDSKGS